jgi:ATP-dependent helicase HrpA
MEILDSNQAKIRGNHVAGFEDDYVAGNELCGVDAQTASIAHNSGAGAHGSRQSIDRLYGTVFLRKPDNCIGGNDCEDDEAVHDLAESKRNGPGDQQDVDKRGVELEEQSRPPRARTVCCEQIRTLANKARPDLCARQALVHVGAEFACDIVRCAGVPRGVDVSDLARRHGSRIAGSRTLGWRRTLTVVPTQRDSLKSRIERCGPADRRALLDRWNRIHDALGMGRDVRREVAMLVRDTAAALQRAEQRRAGMPRLGYPEDLPVSQERERILAALRDNQVVVVCGETGSGKTTQLPKMLLELGCGAGGMIGHTQPRRIAARGAAARLAEELGTPLGDLVGFKVRFGDRTGARTRVKVMTDGVLLAETLGDRDLLQYDAIIIDEAHERSLNIDFLLGYLRRLLPRRPDLKVIITSATIDPERFSEHFDACPILHVGGRLWPVEVRYRPPEGRGLDERDAHMQEAILRAIDEVCAEGPGDVLVFLSGEREIRETAESLRHHRIGGHGHAEVLPLYARLSAQEQMRVFAPHSGRRIVLATNVAETSLTVPGIRFVVDTGLARVNRYSPRTRVERLEVEAISQASADQRAGRCGRLGPGICVRLYSQEDYEKRPRFTDPEILRSNLAGVILQMLSLRLGEVEHFPFIDPPDARLIRDGYETLRELGAIDDHRHLTRTGRELARLPIDPRIGRMLLAARDEPGCCLADVLIIAAAMSLQDPRERPMDRHAQADAAHAKFRDPRGDFVGFLRLWDWWRDARRRLSWSRLRKTCEESFISFVRMREWEDIHRQLAAIVGNLARRPENRRDGPAPVHPAGKEASDHHAITERPPLMALDDGKPTKHDEARIEAIHRALLTGLLANVGRKGERAEYTGTRAVKWSIFPGSSLARAGPTWAMAGEIVRTTRLYARTVAPVRAEWIERAAAHLVSRSHYDPHWDASTGRVMAFERVSLWGLELSSGRRVHYGPIDPVVSHEIFLRSALVHGGMITRAEFFQHNHDLVARVKAMEVRCRRHLLAHETRLAEFYAQRIPSGITTVRELEDWLSRVPPGVRRGLMMSLEDVLDEGAAMPAPEDFPDTIDLGRQRLAVEYRHEPGREDDGVSVRMPLEALSVLSPEPFHWLVPGHLAGKVAALLKGLPREIRRLLPPGEAWHRPVVDALRERFREGSLFEELRRLVLREAKVEIPRAALERVVLPDVLQLRFVVIDEEGRTLATGRDLADLRVRLAEHLRKRNDGTVAGPQQFIRDGLTEWSFGDLPERVDVERFGTVFASYPGLVDRGQSVSLRLFERPENARHASRAGLRRLFMLDACTEVARETHRHPDIEHACTLAGTLGDTGVFRASLIECIVDRALGLDRPIPRSKEEFQTRSREALARIGECVREVCAVVDPILRSHALVLARLNAPHPVAWSEAITDIRDQLANLMTPDFPLRTPWERLRHLPRYLAAIEVRLRRLNGPGVLKDRERMADLAPLWRACFELKRRERELGLDPAAVEEYRWMIEELRVSLFAQELGTLRPVSPKRLQEAWERIMGA